MIKIPKVNLYFHFVLGFFLQLAAIPIERHLLFGNDFTSIFSTLFILFGEFLIINGSWHYAKNKGYSGAFGLLALIHLFGLVILIGLPDRRKDPTLPEPLSRGGNPMMPIFVTIGLVTILGIAYLTHWYWLYPHESAYGFQVNDTSNLSMNVKQFLELDALDPAKITIEVCDNFKCGDLKVLPQFLSRHFQGKQVGNMDSLFTSLNKIGESSPLMQSVQLIDTLVQYKNLIRDESKQDDIIVFIKYRLKYPTELTSQTRDDVVKSVVAIDSKVQSRLFDSRMCPSVFLYGSINIYPLAMENLFWYGKNGLKEPQIKLPIVEIRFNGLKGVFKYLLDRMNKDYKIIFFHVDGEKL